MRNRRLVALVLVVVLATLMLGATHAAAAPYWPGRTMPITAVLMGGEISSFDQHDVGQKCAVHIVEVWNIDGAMKGTIAHDYRPLVDHPCGDFPGGTYPEKAIFYGTFNGTIDGRRGTVYITGVSSFNTTDNLWRVEINLVPGTGTGELIGIYGMMTGASGFWDPTPLTGWYRIK
jgi:hypothetical protein